MHQVALPGGQTISICLDDGNGGQVRLFQMNSLQDAAHVSVVANAIEAQLGYKLKQVIPEQRTVYHAFFEA